ncbi:Chromatin assembly factor 1 subunit B [Smittium mucronatum]|uniref:Chromatin assembly factor 1 subunit B n=1 Tax=Smittium mucronatum TaxID=133383 RepID=A0A1R0H7N0_9FUNG|nr:Chromatin assembly factor 1 subunit B [Smittium mucronatum]
MKVKTAQINWHEKLPIFSVDFDKRYKKTENKIYSDNNSTGNSANLSEISTPKNSNTDKIVQDSDLDQDIKDSGISKRNEYCYRFATGGADSNVRIWTIVETEEGSRQPSIEFRANLSRHTAPVNVVRFCPTDGAIIIWREIEKNQSNSVLIENSVFGDDLSLQGAEVWKPISILRGSLADIYDLAWSPDGKYIISGSIDNTSRIWDPSTY